MPCQPQEGRWPDKRGGGGKVQQDSEQNHAKTSPKGDTNLSRGGLILRTPLCPQDEPAFSPDEVEKLPAALKLEPKDVELVLETSTFIMQQVPPPHTNLPYTLGYATHLLAQWAQ